MKPEQTPLAVIGLGCLFPKADSLEAYWANIMAGVDGITDVPESHWNPEDYYDPDPRARDRVYARRGGFLNPVELSPLEFGISPRDVEAVDTTQLLGLIAAKQALADAGYGDDREFDREAVSVILGVTGALEMTVSLGARLGGPIWRRALEQAGVEPGKSEEVLDRISSSYVEWQENSFPGLLGNVAAGRIANRLDLRGTNCVVDAACASSLSALHLAGLELTSGRADMAVTGGLDTFNDVFMYACFSKTPALSPRGEARPFDADADGTILGEGLGVIVLKRLADAERDGDRVYAIITGVGSSSDGKGNAVYAPSPAGQKLALKRAYAQAGVTAETIGLVEGHGTGTTVGDAVEIEALVDVYGPAGPKGPWCALGSVKSQIGHTKAAAGAAGVIKAALALYHKVLPPTIKVTRPPDLLANKESPLYVNTKMRPWMPAVGHPRRAAVSSFGFGGSNFHLVLEEIGADKPEIVWDGRTQIVALSGESLADIKNALNQRPTGSWKDFRSWAAETRQSFDHRHPYRLLVTAEKDGADLETVFSQAAGLVSEPESGTVRQSPDGAYFGAGEKPGLLGLLFPGQGSQYVGMFRELACRFPRMHKVLAEADAAFGRQDGGPPEKRLSDLIYPHPEFSEEKRLANEEILKDTRTAQPAIGAVALGLYRILEYFGLKPDMAAGHSYGELVALCASGRYGEDELHDLSRLRGSLMAKTNGCQGAMVAVMASADEAGDLIRSKGLNLQVANKNAPRQTVLSGPAEEVDRAAEMFSQAGLGHVRLKVSNAFHSSLMAQAHGAFQEALEHIDFSQAAIPVYANSTAEPYPEASPSAREILAGQLVRPVEFIQQIENMHSAGVRVFLEVGPGSRLTGLVNSILEARPFAALAVDASQGKRSGTMDLARCLAHLTALGYDLDLTQWDNRPRPAKVKGKKPAYTVSICGANQFQPKPLPVRKNEEKKPDVSAAGKKLKMDLLESKPETTDARQKKGEPDKPASSPVPVALTEALRLTQDNLAALQAMQEQTSQRHREFLAGQEAAQKNIQLLIRQQQQLLEAALGSGVQMPAINFEPVKTPPPRPEPILPDDPFEAVFDLPTEPEPAPVTAPPGSEGRDRIQAALLEIVAEQTGYPQEMLGLDMEMDADLGIDSIKRVEILSALSERLPHLPAVGSDQMGTLQTLGQVVDFLSAGPLADFKPAPVQAQPSGADAAETAAVLLEIVAEQTGYPQEMLGLDMEMDADLGIDSIKRVEILSALSERLPHLPAVGSDQMGTLQTLGQVVDFLTAGSPAGPEPPPAAVQTTGADAAETAAVLLEIVAEQTGYPQEMLGLDMEMDADLGIDSIKRVEILSALSERLPHLPAVGTEQLGTLQTLGQVVDFLCSSETAPPEQTPTVKPVSDHVSKILFEVVEDLTGYPPETQHLKLELSADLGLDPIRLVELVDGLRSRLGRDIAVDSARLNSCCTLGDIGTLIEEGLTPADDVDRYVVEAIKLDGAGSRSAVALESGANIWVTKDASGLSEAVAEELEARGFSPEIIDLDQGWTAPPAGLAGLILLPPSLEIEDGLAEACFRLVRQAGPVLRQSGREAAAALATVSRLDGAFGLGDSPVLTNTAAGGLAGLSKTVFREWPEVKAKALDVAADIKDLPAAAKWIVDEFLLAGPMEAGLTANGQFGLEIRAESLDGGEPTRLVDQGRLVIVSGGARGVTAGAALALAQAWQPTLALFGRSPEPGPEPDWAAGLEDEAAIKKALFEQSGTGRTPREIDAECRRILAEREIRRNMAMIEAAGSKVRYVSVDARDNRAVKEAVEALAREFGPVKGLVHGAGVLADRLIEDKTDDQFRQVYSTKVDGLRSFLSALENEDLKFIALFSSSTGRFGRTGQVDYAMANEVLNKTAQQEARRRPDCRVVSFNWGPWAGGMVNPSLEKVFKAEGLSLIPLKAGADYLVRELGRPGRGPVEVVVLGAGSDLSANGE